MNVDDIKSSRFETALELFREGATFTFDGVRFWRDQTSGELIVTVRSRYAWLSNVTEASARIDLGRGTGVYDYLKAASPEFAAEVEDLTVSVVLVHDAGTSEIEIATLENDEFSMK